MSFVMEQWKRIPIATCEVSVNFMPRLESRQCWKNNDGHKKYWHLSLISIRGIFTFVTSGLEMNGCVLSYLEGTVNLQCYTISAQWLLYTVSQCPILSFVPWKDIIKYLQKCVGCTHFVRYCTSVVYCCTKGSNTKYTNVAPLFVGMQNKVDKEINRSAKKNLWGIN